MIRSSEFSLLIDNLYCILEKLLTWPLFNYGFLLDWNDSPKHAWYSVQELVNAYLFLSPEESDQGLWISLSTGTLKTKIGNEADLNCERRGDVFSIPQRPGGGFMQTSSYPTTPFSSKRVPHHFWKPRGLFEFTLILLQNPSRLIKLTESIIILRMPKFSDTDK